MLVAYLIVPVGEGNGDEYGYSCSGMFILSGASCLALGGLGTLLGAVSSTNDENQILMLVEGNRKTHLSREEIKNLTNKSRLCHLSVLEMFLLGAGRWVFHTMGLT